MWFGLVRITLSLCGANAYTRFFCTLTFLWINFVLWLAIRSHVIQNGQVLTTMAFISYMADRYLDPIAPPPSVGDSLKMRTITNPKNCSLGLSGVGIQ